MPARKPATPSSASVSGFRRWLLGILFVGITAAAIASPPDPDPLPPLPPRDNEPPAPVDWAGWESVPRLLGVSQSRTEWLYTYSWDGGQTRSSANENATVFMELERENDPSITALAWRVTDARGQGGKSSQTSTSGSTGSSQTSSQGTYTGAFSLRIEPRLSIRRNDGSFGFATLMEPAGAWSIQLQSRIIEQFQGSREVQDTFPGSSLDTSLVTNVAPRKVMPFSAQWNSHSSIHNGAAGPGESTTHRSASVQFWPDWNDVELVVEIEVVIEPKKTFEAWRPLANLQSASRPGPEPLRIHATLRPKAENPTTAQLAALPGVRRFRFELSDTSREPGVCMNWPPLDPAEGEPVIEEDPNYDLRFAAVLPDAMVVSPRGQKAGVRPLPGPDPTLPSAWAQLDCYDFGAHARLKVVAELSDGREVVGYRKSGSSKFYLINIPERDEGTLIAKSWREEKKTSAPDDLDGDDEPVGDGQKGDGFSTYEEYRGFRVDGKHVSPDPAVKDLFVHSVLGGIEGGGCRLVERHTVDEGKRGLKIWEKVASLEMSETRAMNPNRSPRSPRASSELQHGVKIQFAEPNGHFIISITRYSHKTLHRPKTVEFIALDLASPDLDRTVAHELLHAISVAHHGLTDIGWVRWDIAESVLPLPDGSVHLEFTEMRVKQDLITGVVSTNSGAYPIRVFREGQSTPITPSRADWKASMPMELYVAVRGGEHSGADLCVMRYSIAGAYVPGQRSSYDRVIIDPSRPRIVPPEVDASGRQRLRRICKSCSGNGLNPERHGHATFGGCLHLICVRDSAPFIPPASGLCPDTSQPSEGGAP